MHTAPTRSRPRPRRWAIAAAVAMATLAPACQPAVPPPGPSPESPSIPHSATCDPSQADATAAIQSWLDSLPSTTVVAKLPAGCYRVDGTVLFQGREGLILDGDGVTFARFGTVEGATPFVRITGSRNVGIRGLRVDGGVDPSYQSAYEHQHAFSLDGRPSAGRPGGAGGPNTGITLEGVSANRVKGDFLYVHTTTGVEVIGASFGTDDDPSTIDGSGRQGIAVISGHDITVHQSEVSNAARAILDLEPNVLADEIHGVTFADNTVRQTRTDTESLAFVASGGQMGGAVTVQDVDVSNNTLIGRQMWILVLEPDPAVLGGFAGPETYQRRGYRISGNTSDVHLGYWDPTSAFRIEGVHDLEISGNTVPIGVHTVDTVPEHPAGLLVSRGNHTVRVTGNVLPPGDGDGTNDFVATYSSGRTAARSSASATTAATAATTATCESGNSVDDPARPAQTPGVPAC